MADLNRSINPNRSLNEIPDDLLILILALLPTNESVRSSILSKKWRNLWCSVPILDFDYDLFPPTPDDPETTILRFANFIYTTLSNRPHIPITKFRLKFDSHDYTYKNVIELWMKFAISNTTTELDIDFCNDGPFQLRLGWLNGSMIRDLKLHYCDIVFPARISCLKLNSIRSLYLWSIYLRDKMVADLMSVCVNLESLTIDYCTGLERLKICSSSLKELSLGNKEVSPPCDRLGRGKKAERWVEISCPNLRWISISGFKMDDYYIKNSTSLVKAEVGRFFDYSNGRNIFSYWSKLAMLFRDVKHLKTKNSWYKLLCDDVKSSAGLVYKNLEHLELRTGYSTYEVRGMAALFEICPNITTLSLIGFEDYDVPGKDVLESIKFCIPNLKIVYLRKSRREEKKETGEKEFVSLIKKYGPSLEKVVETY